MLIPIKRSDSLTETRIQALSTARIGSYRTFFGAATDAEALGCYQWNDAFSIALFEVIRLIEVVLRNQFHHAMSRRYGLIGHAISRDWYEYLALNGRSHSKITDITHAKRKGVLLPRNPLPSPDDVVSRLTFGFWPHLLDVEADKHGNPIHWGKILIDVLPGHRQQETEYWNKRKHRDALFARMELCNDLRNRVAHHEPIWKLGRLMREGRPREGSRLVVEAPAPKTPDEALTRLRLLYERLVELLRWLSPALAEEHSRSKLHLHCLRLLHPHTLAHHQFARPAAALNLATVKNLRTLRKALRYATRHRQPTLVSDGDRFIGYMTGNEH